MTVVYTGSTSARLVRVCSAPGEKVPVPPIVREIAAGRDVTAVWVNEVGGVTFRIAGGQGHADQFVKTATSQWSSHLAGEAPRLRWACRHVPVPEVLGAGDGWLHTAALRGRSAADQHWLARPRAAARAIGSGLRALHDALPVAECPFEWTEPMRLAELPPPVDRLVVCHGDACAPNTLIDDSGRCSGHVDLGDLGVADRWADLAVGILSLGWNYGDGPWEWELLDAYGVAEDPVRVDHYRRLWQAGDSTSR
jgi:kanamycin kinase